MFASHCKTYWFNFEMPQSHFPTLTVMMTTVKCNIIHISVCTVNVSYLHIHKNIRLDGKLEERKKKRKENIYESTSSSSTVRSIYIFQREIVRVFWTIEQNDVFVYILHENNVGVWAICMCSVGLCSDGVSGKMLCGQNCAPNRAEQSKIFNVGTKTLKIRLIMAINIEKRVYLTLVLRLLNVCARLKLRTSLRRNVYNILSLGNYTS